PEKYRVAAVLHPNIWGVHGAWQVRAWLVDCLRAGLLLLPPQEGWRAALVAADVVIGDHGSVTSYGAAIGAPVVLAPPVQECFLRLGSLAETVGRNAVRLQLDSPLPGQLRAAMQRRSRIHQRYVAGMITSRPGQAAQILRRTMYRLLDLPEPDRTLTVTPVPLPTPIGSGERIDLTEGA
ncbi:hypothetical protein ACWGJ7_38665, partial [Streptomyces tendae]